MTLIMLRCGMELISTKFPGIYYNILKSGDKTIYVVYKQGRKTVHKAVGRESKQFNLKDACKIRNEILVTLNKGEALPNRITLENACKYYLDSIKHKKTFKDMAFRLQAFKEYIGSNTELKNITTVILTSYISHLKSTLSTRGKGFSPQTIKHYINIVRQMFNFCINTDFYLGRSPFNKAVSTCVPKVNNIMINYFEDREIVKFFEVVNSYEDKNLANVFKFAFYTGLRISEICNLKWDDVDIDNECITLREPKSGRDEHLTINDAAIDILKCQRSLIKVNIKYVFPNTYMEKRTTLRNQFKTLKKKMGLSRYFRIHDLRHNYATMLREGGANLDDIKTALTHKDIKTTMKYAHIKDDHMKKVSNIAVSQVSSKIY